MSGFAWYEESLTPPAVFIALCLVGAALGFWRPRIGMTLALVASICLYLAATPVVASAILARLEAGIPAHPDLAAAQAIVVLGGNIRRGGDDQPDTLGPLTLERVVYAAEAYRRLQLPVLVSGGLLRGTRASEAALMKAALADDFAVPVAWSEERSRTTFENALYARALLQPAGIDTVVLVTQAWHMPRALWSFERVGFRALPFPVPRDFRQSRGIADYLPRIGALNASFRALHEWLGLAYYRLRY